MFTTPAAAHCHAGPRCRRTPCFRVELHEPAGDRPAFMTADACADHFGETAQALSRWAAAGGMDDARLRVSAIDAPPGEPAADLLTSFLFASIPVAP